MQKGLTNVLSMSIFKLIKLVSKAIGLNSFDKVSIECFWSILACKNDFLFVGPIFH